MANSSFRAKATILFFAFFLISATVRADSKTETDTSIKHVDLDNFTLRAGKLQQHRKKARIQHTTFKFELDRDCYKSWDSTYVLTKFDAIADHSIRLNTVQGRLAAFDTSCFDLFLSILQFNEGDTLFKIIPVRFDTQRSNRKQIVFDLFEEGIFLKAAPFYVGYGFHTKIASRSYSYPIYAAVFKGDGIHRVTKNGKTFYRIGNLSSFIFPFTITYLDY